MWVRVGCKFTTSRSYVKPSNVSVNWNSYFAFNPVKHLTSPHTLHPCAPETMCMQVEEQRATYTRKIQDLEAKLKVCQGSLTV